MVLRRSAIVGLACVLTAGLGVACSGGDESETQAAGGAVVVAGEALYADNCASCHGTDLQGTDKGPPQLSSIYAADHHADDSFRHAIESGAPAHHWEFGDMPPVEGLADGEVDAIIAFVRARQAAEGLG